MQTIDKFMDRDFNEIFRFFKKNYLVFLLISPIILISTFIFNQTSVPRYKITSQVLIKQDDPNQNRNLGNVLSFNILGDNTNFNNELVKIKSIPFIEKVIENLNLQLTYYKKNTFRYSELYNESPAFVKYLPSHPQLINAMFELEFINNTDYNLSVKGSDLITYNYALKHAARYVPEINYVHRGKFGELIENDFFSFIINIDSAHIVDYKKKKLYFIFNSINDLALIYQKSLNIEPVNEKVTSGIITYETSNPDKGTDVINQLCNVYVDEDLQRRNHLANITIQYIDKLLGEVSDSLSKSEQQLQQIKSSSQLYDIGQQSSAINQQLLDIDKQRNDIRSRISYYQYVQTHLSENKAVNDLIVPSSMGINDASLSNLITELTNLTSERNNYIDNNQENNPELKVINSKIETIKNSIFGNINFLIKNLEINENDLKSQSYKLSGEISRLPMAQRELLVFERKFKLNDAINTFLQERRAEANITMASSLSNIQVIEPAINLGKVFPKKSQNYIFALILCIILPVGFIMTAERFKVTFSNYEEITKLTSIPVLGKLLHSHKREQSNLNEATYTPYIESLRLLRTNLDYFIRNTTRQVILITSSSENEGKSFTAYNLALGFAMLKKNTVLVSYDLRKPSKYLGVDATNMIGLTSYYIGKATMEDIIVKTGIEKLDIIPAGNIPPNPAELIELDKTKDIFNLLKNMYDYIIVDSPPLYYFTDGFLLMKYSDIKLLVTRHDVTNRIIFTKTIKNIEDKNISNMAIIYNDIPIEGEYRHGYKYYAQGLPKKSKKKKNSA